MLLQRSFRECYTDPLQESPLSISKFVLECALVIRVSGFEFHMLI